MELSKCFNITLDELVKEETVNQGANEMSQKVEETKVPKGLEWKVGIGLCLVGSICLILSGVMVVFSPNAIEQLNAASTITLNGSGVILVLCILLMVIGLTLILRKK